MKFQLSKLFKSKLSIQLFSRIILISGILTFINITVQVFLDYKSEFNYLIKNQSNIINATKGSLEYALKNDLFDEVQVLVNELTKIDFIESVKVTKEEKQYPPIHNLTLNEFNELVKEEESNIKGLPSPLRIFAAASESGKGTYYRGKVIYSSGKIELAQNETFSLVYVPLKTLPNNKIEHFLAISTSTEYIKDKVITNLLVIIATQGAKTFIVSFFLMFLFYFTVVRHVNELTHWLQNFNPSKEIKVLKVPTQNAAKNELFKLKDLVGKMGYDIHQHTIGLERLVEERTKELEDANAKLQEIAYTDNLTSVANRHLFFKTAHQEINRAQRLSYHLGLIILDLDHFKQINDNYGHEAGDAVLTAVAKAMSECLREQDCLGRIGGEEFAILLPGIDKDGLQSLTQRLQESVKNLQFDFLQNRKITISIGFTVVGQNESIKLAMKRADDFLYQAKSKGRDCAVTDFIHLRRIMA